MPTAGIQLLCSSLWFWASLSWLSSSTTRRDGRRVSRDNLTALLIWAKTDFLHLFLRPNCTIRAPLEPKHPLRIRHYLLPRSRFHRCNLLPPSMVPRCSRTFTHSNRCRHFPTCFPHRSNGHRYWYLSHNNSEVCSSKSTWMGLCHCR